MYVLVDLEDEVVELVEPDDLDGLHLEVTGGFDEDAVSRLLGMVGRLETVEKAYLSVSAVRSLARESATAEGWSERFELMISELRARGDFDDSSTAVRVAVEWPPDTVA